MRSRIRIDCPVCRQAVAMSNTGRLVARRVDEVLRPYQ